MEAVASEPFFFNPFDEAIRRDPYPLFARARREHPAWRHPGMPVVSVFTHAECKILCSLPEPDGTLMAVLLGAGLRKAEARNLMVRRVDLEHGEIQVRKRMEALA